MDKEDLRTFLVGVLAGIMFILVGLASYSIAFIPPRCTYVQAYEDLKGNKIENYMKEYYPKVWVKFNAPPDGK